MPDTENGNLEKGKRGKMKIKPEILRVYGVTDASWTGRFTLLEQVEQAIQAEQAGADYLGVGAVFGTSTKMDAEKISLERIKEICQAVKIPVVAIGGVQKDNFPELVGTGVAGAALVSAIFSAQDIEEECRKLRNISEQIVCKS